MGLMLYLIFNFTECFHLMLSYGSRLNGLQYYDYAK